MEMTLTMAESLMHEMNWPERGGRYAPEGLGQDHAGQGLAQGKPQAWLASHCPRSTDSPPRARFR